MVDSIANFRHDLLTPVNHIIGYCEILIEDAEGSGQEMAMESLQGILHQGRQLLEDIDDALPRVEGIVEADFSALRQQLRVPLNQILEACDGMRWGADASALAGFEEDLGKVRIAAASLMKLADHMVVNPGTDASFPTSGSIPTSSCDALPTAVVS